MLLGLRTVAYPAPDLAAGARWYETVFGVAPYFNEPFYVGFSIGGFELGLVPDGVPGANGAVVYWGVDDIAAVLDRLLALGAAPLEPVTDVGGGIYTACVLDPFGNKLGIIKNPHFRLADVR